MCLGIVAIFFVNAVLAASGQFDLPEHGSPIYVSYDLSFNSTTLYVMNYTRPREGMFAYIWLRTDCEAVQTQGSVDLIRSNQEYGWSEYIKDLPHRVRMTAGTSPSTRSTYYWVFALYEQDCINSEWCAFGLVIAAPAPKCIAWIRAERGRMLSIAEKYDSRHHLIQSRRLFAIRAPPEDDLPVRLKMSIKGKVFISYAWGYTTDLSTAIRFGSFVFELPVLQVYTVNDPLFVWIDPQSMEYELTFKSATEQDMHYLIIILIPSVVFCVTFVMIFFGMYICCQGQNAENQSFSINDVIVADYEESPTHNLATYEDLMRISSIMAWGSESEKKRVKCNNCVVCMEKFVIGDLIRVLRCRHCFHQVCIDPWLLAKRDTCPICYQSINAAQDLYRSSTRSPQTAIARNGLSPIDNEPTRKASFVQRFSNFFKFPSKFEDDMTYERSISRPYERSISRPFEKRMTPSSDGESVQLPSTTKTSGKTIVRINAEGSRSSWTSFGRRFSGLETPNQETPPTEDDKGSLPPYRQRVQSEDARRRSFRRVSEVERRHSGRWSQLKAGERRSSRGWQRLVKKESNSVQKNMLVPISQKSRLPSYESVSLKKGSTASSNSNKSKSIESMSLKKGDDLGGEDFGRAESSMSTKRSADQSIGVCRRIVKDNSDTCGKVVTSCTSDAEVVTQAFWDSVDVTDNSIPDVINFASGASAHGLMNAHDLFNEHVSTSTTTYSRSRGLNSSHHNSLMNVLESHTSCSLNNPAMYDSRPSVYDSFLSVPSPSVYSNVPDKTSSSSISLSDTGAGKTVAHILLNRVSQRGDSFVLDNSPSYPRWVDGSPRGPPRLSTIDVNFARNSVITRFHQSLPENAPSTPHAPLPAFLTSKQASNSSKKSDSELTTSLKLLHQSSDERLEFYGIDGKIQEESESDFTSSAIQWLQTNDNVTEDLPASRMFEDAYGPRSESLSGD